MTVGRVVDLPDGGAERKEWCEDCHAFLARHVYRRVADSPTGPHGPTTLLWDRCELAPGLVTSEQAFIGKPAHYARA